MEREDKITRLLDISIKYRGLVIHQAIMLEKEIEEYIIRYFVGDDTIKGVKMLELIIDRVSFDQKTSIFSKMIESLDIDNFDKKYGKLMSDIRYIKDIRNRFAHYATRLLFEEYEEIPKEFELISHRNSTDIKTFGKGEFKIYCDRVDRCIIEIRKITTT